MMFVQKKKRKHKDKDRSGNISLILLNTVITLSHLFSFVFQFLSSFLFKFQVCVICNNAVSPLPSPSDKWFSAKSSKKVHILLSALLWFFFLCLCYLLVFAFVLIFHFNILCIMSIDTCFLCDINYRWFEETLHSKVEAFRSCLSIQRFRISFTSQYTTLVVLCNFFY